jgi:hypothetical protein
MNISNNQFTGLLPHTLATVKDIGTKVGACHWLLKKMFCFCSLYSLARILVHSSSETLSLEQNRFSGVVPTSYASMTKLQSFLLQHNDIYGSVPSKFCDLKAGFLKFHHLKRLEMDCLLEVVCDCCDKCY